MRSTQQFSITVPNEMAEMIRAKVQSGEYVSESEVFRDGLRALKARDRLLEKWISDEVVPAYDRMQADPSRGIPIKDIRTRLDSKLASARKG